jgi:addiction module HigA family antidote
MSKHLPGFEPQHPGEILGEDILPAAGLSVTAASERLRVSRQTLHSILSSRAGVSPEMALRLSRLFGNSPQFWTNMQATYDLWHIERERASELARIKELHAA